MKAISIIVLFHNNDHFDMVINALLKQRINKDEIIIVNDNSDRIHLQELEKFRKVDGITIINADKAGNRSYNRNLGAAHSRNELLLFVDGDMVLMDNCLHLIRMALISGYVGAFGNIFQGGNTPEQMNLLLGFDYLEFLRSDATIENFYKLNIAHDRRTNLIAENVIYHSEWQFYYSGYCAATKKAFYECGQFNETFKGWGAEDVEFGYRLAKCGNIKFLANAQAYHLSHKRDLYSIMQNNKKNLYLFFSQQLTPELEIYLTFHLSTNIIDSVRYIKEQVIQLNIDTEHRLNKIGELSVLPVSSTNPDGSVAYIDNNSKTVQLNLLGMALPFNDNQFECANLTADIFCYPECIATRIVQECFRVAKKVKIYKCKYRPRIHWTSAVTGNILSRRSHMDRTNYHAHIVNDFNFSDNGEYYTIIGGVATKMPFVHIDNLPNVYPNKVAKSEKFIVFDLIGNLTDKEIDNIASAHNFEVDSVYKLRLREDQKKIRLSDVVFGELQLLNIPFAYVIGNDTEIDSTDIWWNYKHRHSDEIIVYQV